MTTNHNVRYVEAAARNVRLLGDRVAAVNTGTSRTRQFYLNCFAERKVDLAALKIHAGVRKNDSTYDGALQLILDQVAATVKKNAKKAAAVESPPQVQVPQQGPAAEADFPAHDDVEVIPNKPKKFKKGRKEARNIH